MKAYMTLVLAIREVVMLALHVRFAGTLRVRNNGDRYSCEGVNHTGFYSQISMDDRAAVVCDMALFFMAITLEKLVWMALILEGK